MLYNQSMDKMINVFGISIGGTKCAVSYWKGNDDKWTFVWKKQIATLKRGHVPILQELCNIIDESGIKPDKIGIICGGPLDAKRGIIQSPPNLHGFDNVHITDFFDTKYNVKSRLVNDADAGALAEWKFGAGKGTENMLFLTFGTGFGAGLIINGKLYSGTNGSAGEIGHVRLSKNGGVGYNKVGSVEGFVSGGGMAQTGKRVAIEAIKKSGKSELAPDGYLDRITAKLICERARLGCKESKKVIKITGERLGQTVAILIDLFNPEKIVIGGIYPRAKDLLEGYALKVAKKEALTSSLDICQILPASLGESIDEYASLCSAIVG